MKKVPFLIFFAVCVVMLLTPPCANAGTFIGEFCFKLTNHSDLFVWNFEIIGEGSFITATVTGMNTANAGRVMSGGGIIIGSNLKLFVGEGAAFSPYVGQLHSIVIDLTSPTFSGTDDIVFHNSNGTHLILPGEPLSLVPCP
ncbi:MAG: hypothetical protein H6Q92_347 [Nitrospirae bacterium]|nr:hypothetical protein [Nitrospirota bacterium]